MRDEVFSDPTVPLLVIYISVENEPNQRRLVLVYLQNAIFLLVVCLANPVPIWCLSAVVPTLSRLLNPSCKRLCKDVLPLHLCKS